MVCTAVKVPADCDIPRRQNFPCAKKRNVNVPLALNKQKTIYQSGGARLWPSDPAARLKAGERAGSSWHVLCTVLRLLFFRCTKSSGTKKMGESEAKVYFKDTRLRFATVSFGSAGQRLEIAIMTRCASRCLHSMVPRRKLLGHFERGVGGGKQQGALTSTSQPAGREQLLG